MPLNVSGDTPKWVLAFFSLVGMLLAGLWKIFKIGDTIEESAVKIEGHEEVIGKLKIAFPNILSEESDIQKLLTAPEHAAICSDKSIPVMKKLKKLEDCVNDGHKLLAKRMDKMDKLREESRKETANIEQERTKREIELARTLGRIEEHLDNA
jgi:hypothetical protein